jgi:hypothetical protein
MLRVKQLFKDVLILAHTAITEISVHQILKAYPNLQMLALNNCAGVSVATKGTVLRKFALSQLQSNVSEMQLMGTICLRKARTIGKLPAPSQEHSCFHLVTLLLLLISTESHLPLDQVIEMGAAPRLLEFLSFSNFPVCVPWFPTAHTIALVDAGAISCLGCW